jgi:hypothetical protein
MHVSATTCETFEDHPTDRMVCHAGICLVADEGADCDAQTDTPIENTPLPLQLWVF